MPEAQMTSRVITAVFCENTVGFAYPPILNSIMNVIVVGC